MAPPSEKKTRLRKSPLELAGVLEVGALERLAGGVNGIAVGTALVLVAEAEQTGEVVAEGLVGLGSRARRD